MAVSRYQRVKGARNETAVGHLLAEYGFELVDMPCGKAVPDYVAVRNGITYCVECKDAAIVDFKRWRGQARQQRDNWNAAHKGVNARWLLIAHWPGYAGVYMVEGQDIPPTTWRSNEARRAS